MVKATVFFSLNITHGRWLFSSVQSLSHVRLFVTPWSVACQASLSITNSRSLLNSCTSSWWSPPTILSSVIPFFSCLESFPASGSFPTSQFFASSGQSTGGWTSASVLWVNIQSRLISFRIDWLDFLVVQGTLKSLLQHHSSKASILWCSNFFMVQLSYLYMTTEKNHSFYYMNFCPQRNVSAF